MVCLDGEVLMLAEEGGFVVEKVDAVQMGCEFGCVECVRELCVAAWRFGWCSKQMVRYYIAFGCGPVHACFDVVDL